MNQPEQTIKTAICRAIYARTAVTTREIIRLLDVKPKYAQNVIWQLVGDGYMEKTGRVVTDGVSLMVYRLTDRDKFYREKILQQNPPSRPNATEQIRQVFKSGDLCSIPGAAVRTRLSVSWTRRCIQKMVRDGIIERVTRQDPATGLALYKEKGHAEGSERRRHADG